LVSVELSDAGGNQPRWRWRTRHRPEDLSVGIGSRSLRTCGRSSAEKKHSGKSEEELRGLEGFIVSSELPAYIDISQVSADVTHDVLEVLLPKALRKPEVEASEDIKN
jgi:hypothetical protein